jgi:pyruvate kinase
VRRNRSVKIIATLGPASSSPEMIERLFLAGADVFRINMSHTAHKGLEELHGSIRQVEAKLSRPIGILADLQGPKLRVGRLAAGPMKLAVGDIVRFDLDPEPGGPNRVPLPHPEVFAALAPGVELLIDDGKVRLEVESAGPAQATARVVVGGTLSDRKGVVPSGLAPANIADALGFGAGSIKRLSGWRARSRSGGGRALCGGLREHAGYDRGGGGGRFGVHRARGRTGPRIGDI